MNRRRMNLLSQEFGRDGGDGGEDPEGGEVVTSVAGTLGCVALVPVAEADVNVVVGPSLLLETNNTMTIG